MSSATWYGCVGLGWSLIAVAAWKVVTTPGLELAPAFVMIATLAVLLELLPLVQGRGHDPQGVVMSTAFSAALLFVWGVWPAVLIIAIASVIADCRAGKQWWKTIFNPGQYALSIGAAYAVMLAANHGASLNRPLADVHAADLWWMVGAWVVYFAVNLALVAGVLAWSAPFHEVVRDDFWHYAAMTFSVLALSPLVAILAQHTWELIPLLLVPLMLIYYTAQMSLAREHAAGHDALTGLPNRATLRYEVGAALAAHHRDAVGFALMIIDLDDFKTVNDTLGHQVGDDLLVEIANRLRASLRPGDLVARLGGDEFAVIVFDGFAENVRGVAERIRDGVGTTIALENISLEVQFSLGVALCPGDGTDSETLLRHADVAMYRAKKDRTGIELYSAEYDHNDTARLGLISELRRALDEHELVLHYQPKQGRDGRPIGMEALVRWPHPVRGYIPPDHFVPLAERSGIMPALTARVIQLALAEMETWRAAGIEVPVAVNVSPTDLLGADLPDLVATELAARGLPASVLCLELTERVMTHDLAGTPHALERLREMGVTISLDDFGTGYSSLIRLGSMPVDEIKIDRMFVARLTDGPRAVGIVRTLIALAHALGVPAIAEGVETETQLRLLEGMGCDGVQGWHIARPMPGDVATEWLRARIAPNLRAANANASPVIPNRPARRPVPSLARPAAPRDGSSPSPV
jgi:diguanylate cyclase (GGDEF)-like protein